MYVTDERDARAVVCPLTYSTIAGGCRPHSDPSGRVVPGPTPPLRAAAAAVVRPQTRHQQQPGPSSGKRSNGARKNAAHECAVLGTRAAFAAAMPSRR